MDSFFLEAILVFLVIPSVHFVMAPSQQTVHNVLQDSTFT